MQLEFQTITPEQASDLLTNHNPSNRRLDTRHALFLAQEMERGTFRPDNGDSIRIEGFNYVKEEKLTLKPAQIVVIDFAADKGGIFFAQ